VLQIQFIFCSQKTPFCSYMSGVHTILTFTEKTIRSVRVFLSFPTVNFLFSGCKFSTGFYRNPRTCARPTPRSTFHTENLIIRLPTENRLQITHLYTLTAPIVECCRYKLHVLLDQLFFNRNLSCRIRPKCNSATARLQRICRPEP
jgi:hypothetical protein